MTNFLWDNLFKKTFKDQTIETFRNCFLFKDLNPRELRLLKNIADVRTYQPGESIFKQSSMGVGMYIILNGCVDVYVDDTVNATKEDHAPEQVFITRLKKGDFFGEMALIEDNNRRTATAIAGEEAQLIGFFKPGLQEITERSPATGVKILYRLSEVMGRRLKETTVRITDLKRQLERIRNTK